MQSTAGAKGPVDYANELSTPFFTRGQLLAFRHPPSQSAIEKVLKAGSHDYIPHEYIRAVLDRYIGTGRWEFSATLHSLDKEVLTKEDRGTEVQMLALTASVNVDLRIHARDGSGQTLTYSAIGSSTHQAGVEKGYGSITANAIGSAESLGLKRAASNLGKAFGFDLKSKVKKEDLPPPLDHFNQKVNEHYANKFGTPLPFEIEQNPPSERLRITSDPSPSAADAQESNVSPIRAEESEKPAHDEKATDDAWDLSKVPDDFPGWLSCLETLIGQLSNLSNEREIKTFVRRNKKVIGKLPTLPAENGHPERDFVKRWERKLAERYDELGIKRPKEIEKAA